MTAVRYFVYFFIVILMLLPGGFSATDLSLKASDRRCHDAEGAGLFSCRWDTALTPMSTLDDIIKTFKKSDHAMNDQGFIAQLAKGLVVSGHMAESPWPPGMVLIEAALYRISPNFPIGAALVVLISIAWAAAFSALYEAISPRHLISATATFVAPLAVLTLPTTQEMFQLMVFNPEPLALGLFMFGAALCIIAERRESHWTFAAAGAVFALSAYLRAQVDMTMYCLLAAFVGLIVVRFIIGQPKRISWIKGGLALLIAYHAVTLPYRMQHNLRWGQVGDNMLWAFIWKRPAEIPIEQFGFLTGAGGCMIDERRCEFAHQMSATLTSGDYFRLTMASYITHPIEWLKFKLPTIREYWFGDGQYSMPTTIAAIFALLVFLAAFFVRGTSMPLLVLVATAGGVLGPALLAHLEPRFLFLLKILAVFLVAPTLSEFLLLIRERFPTVIAPVPSKVPTGS